MNDYQAYLIRLWRESAETPWRAELVSPHTGERRFFAAPEQLYAFIEQQLREDSERHLVNREQ